MGQFDDLFLKKSISKRQVSELYWRSILSDCVRTDNACHTFAINTPAVIRFMQWGLIVIISITFAFGCTSSPSDSDSDSDNAPLIETPSGPAYGVSLSPANFSQERFTAFFDEAKEVGNMLGWGGTVDNIGDPTAAPTVVANLWDDRVFIQTSPFSQHNGESPAPFDSNRDQWLNDVVDFVSEHEVHYLGIGVEVNFLRSNDLEAYDLLVDWYDEVYDEVKNVSPGTLVFPTFQYERMLGKHGGLWGGDPNAPEEWETLNDFTKRDLTAFTTFPFLIYQRLEDIPNDFYAPILEHVDGDVAFTEIAWPHTPPAAGWDGNPESQEGFVNLLYEIAPELELAMWVFLYDQPLGDPFNHIGMVEIDGTPRPAWEAWRVNNDH